MAKKIIIVLITLICSFLIVDKAKALDNSMIFDYNSSAVTNHINKYEINEKAEYLRDFVDKNVLGKIHDGANNLYTDYLIFVNGAYISVMFVRNNNMVSIYNRIDYVFYAPITIDGYYYQFEFSLNNTYDAFMNLVNNNDFKSWKTFGQNSILGMKKIINTDWNSTTPISYVYSSTFPLHVESRGKFDLRIGDKHYDYEDDFPTSSTIIKPPFTYITGFSNTGEDTSLELNKINFEASFNELFDSVGFPQNYDIRFQYIDYFDNILPEFLGYEIYFKNKYTNNWENVKNIEFTNDVGEKYFADNLFKVTYKYDSVRQFLDFNIISDMNMNFNDYDNFKIEFHFDHTLYTDINVFQNYIFGSFYRSDLIMDGYVRYFFKDGDYNAFLSGTESKDFSLFVPINSLINPDINMSLFSYDCSTFSLVDNYSSYFLNEGAYPGYNRADLSLNYEKNIVYVLRKTKESSFYFYVPDYISVSFYGSNKDDDIYINTPDGVITVPPDGNIGEPPSSSTSINGLYDSVYKFLLDLKGYSVVWNMFLDRIFVSLPKLLYDFIIVFFILFCSLFLMILGGWRR